MSVDATGSGINTNNGGTDPGQAGQGGQDQANPMQQDPYDPVFNRMFHAFSDVDSDTSAQHHTIGPGVTQAASGAHTHDGNNSPLLFNGTITGSIGGNTALQSLITLITQQTNFTNGTTA